ncbi:MAG: LysM peptidoglycan-binding domain-containing protein [Cocleimonas sp.]|nr:LysM peptidoglycan-binding domain-containing protein [Cocleimonas sp.]
MSLAKLVIRTSVLSATTLFLASGCSDYKFLKLEERTIKPVVHKADPYDSHYGMPERANNDGYATQPKYQYKKTGLTLKTTAPARYKVKKGDTLWGIANKFLKDPWFWPEIWDKNKRLKNPHLIFPGDLLTIHQARRTVKKGNQIVEVLVPQIRVERIGNGKAISTLSPFLAWPRVLSTAMIENAPYIIDGENKHLLIEDGETIYIKKLHDRRIGQTYPIFRKGKPLHDPETRELLGYEVVYTADASITRGVGDISSATILNTKREVHVGDRLLKNIDEKVVLDAPMIAPRHKVRATVLSLYEANLISGTGMIVTLDSGTAEGIKPGHILGVYKQGKTVNDPYQKIEQIKYKYLKTQVPVKVALPPERIATAVVYKVDRKLSYALITQSDHPVKKGHKIGNP